jgi:hypothetical protein
MYDYLIMVYISLVLQECIVLVKCEVKSLSLVWKHLTCSWQ